MDNILKTVAQPDIVWVFGVTVECMDVDVAPLSDFMVIYAPHIWPAVCDCVETEAECLQTTGLRAVCSL